MSVYGYIRIAPKPEEAAAERHTQGSGTEQNTLDSTQRQTLQGSEQEQRGENGRKKRGTGEQEQRAAMLRSGVSEEHIFLDTTEQRPAYRQMLRTVKKGDRIVLAALESLGNTMQEIQEQWQLLTEKKAVLLTILDMPPLCTSTGRSSLDTLVSEIVTETLSYLMEKQKQLRHEQQVRRIQEAKSRGVRCGRAPLEIPEGFQAVYAKWEAGIISVNQAAKSLGVANKTFKKWVENSAEIMT